MIREVVVDATIDALNFALEDLHIAADRVMAIILVEGNYIAAVPGGGPKYRVLYRAAESDGH